MLSLAAGAHSRCTVGMVGQWSLTVMCPWLFAQPKSCDWERNKGFRNKDGQMRWGTVGTNTRQKWKYEEQKQDARSTVCYLRWEMEMVEVVEVVEVVAVGGRTMASRIGSEISELGGIL